MSSEPREQDLAIARRQLELLRLENQMLRAHLAGTGRGERIALPDDVIVDAETYERMVRAEKDLRWVIRRLRSGPLSWVVRRRAGFRRLEREWLD